MASDDLLALLDDTPETAQAVDNYWYILVVDDEPEVHSVTRFALEDFKFRGKGIRLLNAYSGREAVQVMKGRNDVSLIIMDVVMETDSAGLDAIRTIREEQKNWLSRIILRTGQPGQAPEQQVILNYDINDYKSKTELTATKLFSAVVTALRSFDDLMRLEESQQGLRRMLKSFTNEVIEQAVESFLNGALTQIESLIRLGDHSTAEGNGAFVAINSENGPKVIAATGQFESWVGQVLPATAARGYRENLQQTLSQRVDCYGDNYAVYTIVDPDTHESSAFLFAGESQTAEANLSPSERKLLSDFLVGYRSASQFAVRIRSLITDSK